MTRPGDYLSWWKTLFLIPVAALALLLLPLLLVGFVHWNFALLFSIWIVGCRDGHRVLFVYSDSPNWQEDIPQNYFPRLDERTVVLNWSERAKWRNSLAAFAFRHWGGRREFNPLAVVFRPFRKTRGFRFHQPFQDAKHGKPSDLASMEAKFFGLVVDAGCRNS
jgi:hypothetical protein